MHSSGIRVALLHSLPPFLFLSRSIDMELGFMKFLCQLSLVRFVKVASSGPSGVQLIELSQLIIITEYFLWWADYQCSLQLPQSE